MAKGIKIAENRVDVDRATPSELVLDSTGLGSFKIHKTVELEIVSTYSGGPAAEYLVSEPHGLTYAPATFAIVSDDYEGYTYKVPFFQGNLRSLKVFADEVNIYASAVALEATTYTFKIIIFREKIA